MNIYENNKQLLTVMGGDSVNLATDYEVRKAILDLLGGDSSNCNSIYEVDKQILNIYLEVGGGTGGGDCDLIPITITENGVYSRESGGYSEVTVNVEIPECPEIPLTEITINSNGTYIPEEGGYNKVVVDVAGGGGGAVGKKLKVISIRFSNYDVVNGTIDMDNVYNHIDFSETVYASEMFSKLVNMTTLDLTSPNFDTSKVVDMREMFAFSYNLTQLDLSNFNVSNVHTISGMFKYCEALQSIDVTNWDVNAVGDMYETFSGCQSLTQLDLTNWFAGSLYSLDYFSVDSGIINYVGGRTIDDVIANNIGIFNGLLTSASYVMSDLADRASLRALINGLAGVDPEVDGERILFLSAANLETMTEEDIAIATERGWTISA